MTEQELYNHLKERIIDLEVSEKTNSRYDCKSKISKMYIELKCRRKHYPTLLLEYPKYKHLVDEATKLGYTPWYINSTPEGIFAFKLDKDESKYEWTDDMMPSKTDFYGSKKILKKVTYIDITNHQRIF
jgi:hypothetical protein